MTEEGRSMRKAPNLVQRCLRWHIAAYAVAVLLAVTGWYIWPADRSLFIPILIWGCGVLAHFLYVRTVNTDEDWVERRSERISLNATDLSHIESIRERHETREAARARAPEGKAAGSEGSG